MARYKYSEGIWPELIELIDVMVGRCTTCHGYGEIERGSEECGYWMWCRACDGRGE